MLQRPCRAGRWGGVAFTLCQASQQGWGSNAPRGGASASARPPALIPARLRSPPCLCSKQLLTAQGVTCAHIYSALDQTARKINLAKFTHNKCSTLIVTDLAARGLDIPLLDNVINYSFPAKGKLFLHRVGEEPGGGEGRARCHAGS